MNLALITDVPISFLHNGRPRISWQRISLHLTVITLHFGSVAETPAPYCPHTLFINSIMMKQERAKGHSSEKRREECVGIKWTVSRLSPSSIKQSINHSIYLSIHPWALTIHTLDDQLRNQNLSLCLSSASQQEISDVARNLLVLCLVLGVKVLLTQDITLCWCLSMLQSCPNCWDEGDLYIKRCTCSCYAEWQC